MPKIIATKKDWINLGLNRFKDNGEKGIVVEEMAKTLKVNKSSFYHHFKTKNDFIFSLIEFWIEFDTKHIINDVEAAHDPTSKFVKLIEIIFKKDNNLDFNFYLKKYARNKKRIQNIIYEIDQTRVEYVAGLLKEMGFSKKESQEKSKIFYKYLIGYHEVNRYNVDQKDYVAIVLKEISHFIKINHQ